MEGGGEPGGKRVESFRQGQLRVPPRNPFISCLTEVSSEGHNPVVSLMSRYLSVGPTFDSEPPVTVERTPHWILCRALSHLALTDSDP